MWMMWSPLLCLCLHSSVLLDFSILLDFYVYGITSLLTFGLNQFSFFVCIAWSQASVSILVKDEIGDSVCLWTVSFFELVAVEKSQCRYVTIYILVVGYYYKGDKIDLEEYKDFSFYRQIYLTNKSVINVTCNSAALLSTSGNRARNTTVSQLAVNFRYLTLSAVLLSLVVRYHSI